jgi:Rrf2 family protein
MISLTSQYAILAVLHIARSGRWCTADDIAAAANAPRGYISKVLHTLAGAGIIVSQRGLHGGFRLNGEAIAMTAYDIVHAIDPQDRLAVRARERDAMPEGPVGRLYSDIRRAVDGRLRRSVITDLAAEC